MIAKLEKSLKRETPTSGCKLRTKNNSPLVQYKATVNIALDELKLTDSVREEIEIIYKTTYIGQPVSQLLLYSDKKPKPQKEVDLTL